ncbi:MAG: hypothetical protein PHF51_04385 [Candidatus ainarchaeum sp.]|nr:hypothetical protein [Candidatus ainarchaeum sp.]
MEANGLNCPNAARCEECGCRSVVRGSACSVCMECGESACG